MTGLLDTNVALYLLGGRLAAPLPTGSYGVSVITEMELLAWPLAYHRRRKEDSRVPRATCHLRIDSVDPRASCAASETAAFKAAGRRSLRHGDGIRRGTLDE